MWCCIFVMHAFLIVVKMFKSRRIHSEMLTQDILATLAILSFYQVLIVN